MAACRNEPPAMPLPPPVEVGVVEVAPRALQLVLDLRRLAMTAAGYAVTSVCRSALQADRATSVE